MRTEISLDHIDRQLQKVLAELAAMRGELAAMRGHVAATASARNVETIAAARNGETGSALIPPKVFYHDMMGMTRGWFGHHKNDLGFRSGSMSEESRSWCAKSARTISETSPRGAKRQGDKNRLDRSDDGTLHRTTHAPDRGQASGKAEDLQAPTITALAEERRLGKQLQRDGSER